jgi:hypothetical protein
MVGTGAEMTDVTGKALLSEALVEGHLDASKQLAGAIDNLDCQQKCEELTPQMIGSPSNAFPSQFKELDADFPC